MYSISPPNGKSQNQNHLFDKPPLLNPPPLNLKPQKTLHLDLSLLWIGVPKSNFKVYFNAKETKKRVGSTEDHGGKKHIENCRNQWITDNKPFICSILNIYIYIYIYELCFIGINISFIWGKPRSEICLVMSLILLVLCLMFGCWEMVALRVWILEFCYLGPEKISVSPESQLALIFELGFVFYWKNIIDYIWFLSWILQIYKNIVDFLVGFWIFSKPWKMVSSIDIIYNFCLQIILKLYSRKMLVLRLT